mgnify:FL=1
MDAPAAARDDTTGYADHLAVGKYFAQNRHWRVVLTRVIRRRHDDPAIADLQIDVQHVVLQRQFDDFQGPAFGIPLAAQSAFRIPGDRVFLVVSIFGGL